MDGKGSCMFVHSFYVVVHVHDVVFRDSKPLMSGSPNAMISQCILLFTCSLQGNKIGVDGAQALGEGLQHCTNLQVLKLVMCVLT